MICDYDACELTTCSGCGCTVAVHDMIDDVCGFCADADERFACTAPRFAERSTGEP